jgi:hypothetical protein
LKGESDNDKQYQSVEYTTAGNENDELLQTIRVPNNLAHLSSRLPKSNYMKKREDNKR